MNNALRIILPMYLLAYFAIAFVWRSLLVRRQTGINPFVFGRSDSAYDFIGRVLVVTFALLAVAILLFSFSPGAYTYLVPIWWLEVWFARWAGLILIFASLIWTVVAQTHLGRSWRIGIDQQHRTELISTGLFSISRNPIFFGMRASLFGVFLVIPNALTLLTLVLGDVVMQIQVRLEEEHLRRMHGADYESYCRRARRWI